MFKPSTRKLFSQSQQHKQTVSPKSPSLLQLLLISLITLPSLSYGQAKPDADIVGDLTVGGIIKQMTLPVDSQDVVTKEYFDKRMIQFGMAAGFSIQKLILLGYSPKDLMANGIAEVDTFIGNLYAGGIIVHMYPDGSGLTAKPIRGEIRQWGCNSTDYTRAENTGIGAGLGNTLYLVNNCGDSNFAAKLAYDYISEGYDDWFLPSRDELVACLNVGEHWFRDQTTGASIYWSSSQIDGFDAYAREVGAFLDPFKSFSKLTNGTVIAMRKFE